MDIFIETPRGNMISDITDRLNTIYDVLDKLSARAKKSGTFYLPAGNAKAIDDLSGEAHYDLECIKNRYFELVELVKETEEEHRKKMADNFKLRNEVRRLKEKLGVVEQDRKMRIGKIISKQS